MKTVSKKINGEAATYGYCSKNKSEDAATSKDIATEKYLFWSILVTNFFLKLSCAPPSCDA